MCEESSDKLEKREEETTMTIGPSEQTKTVAHRLLIYVVKRETLLG